MSYKREISAQIAQGLNMLIGDDFNKKGKNILKELAELTGKDTEVKIPVQKLNEVFNYERNEMKNLLEYLESKECLKIATIGGPFLYGHITITDKGIARASK